MNIIFDCDDVLLDWMSGFRAWLLRRSIRTFGEPTTWNLDEWLGFPSLPLIRAFNTSPSFGQLNPVAGAQRAVASLYSAGHKLHVITSCLSDDPATKARRENNLDRVFGDVFSSINCIPLGESKVAELEEIGSGIWIEDNPNHALDGFLMGFETYCLRKSHNADWQNFGNQSSFTWIDDFEPIIDAYARKAA